MGKKQREEVIATIKILRKLLDSHAKYLESLGTETELKQLRKEVIIKLLESDIEGQKTIGSELERVEKIIGGK